MGAFKQGAKVAKNKMSLATKIGIGANIGFGLMDYKAARQEGKGVVGSAATAATTFAMGEVLGWWYPVFSLGKEIPGAAVSAVEGIGKYQRQMARNSRRIPFAHSNFNDYKQAFTMRQAGMQLAQNSQYNLQQTMMGNEASYLR